MEKVILGGLKLAYERRGRGAPLVLIHGYPLDHSIWNEVASLLESDFDLILPDVRGFGESSSEEKKYSILDLARDVIFLLDHLKIPQTAIAGHSMGGYIALALAREFPARLSGLALVSSQTFADTPDRKMNRYQTADEVQAKGVHIIADAMTDKLSPIPAVRNLIRPLIEQQNPIGISGALRAMAERDETTLTFSGLRLPLVLIHGDADNLIPVDRARELKARLPFTRLVEIRGGGHMPMLESPQVTAEALKYLL